MYYIHQLRSKDHPDQTCVGSTSDLRKRLAEHNARKSIHTNKFKPWNLMAYVALPKQHLAEDFGKIPEGWIRARVGEEALTYAEWTEILTALPLGRIPASPIVFN